MNTNGISEDERLVLRLISNGLSSRQIGELLYIGFQAAETYRKQLLIKFSAKNSAELIKKATRAHTIE